MANETPHPIKIAIGVALGMLAASICLRACDRAIEQERIDEATKQFQAAMNNPDHPFARRAAELQAKEATERDAATLRLRNRMAATQAEFAASAQAIASRDAAWQRYYKRPKECDNPPTDQAFIECSNRAIQARQQFDRSYRP